MRWGTEKEIYEGIYSLKWEELKKRKNIEYHIEGENCSKSWSYSETWYISQITS